MTAIRPANLLIPQHIDLNKWAVIACDQHSANQTYWEELGKYVGDAHSALHIIFPEAYLDMPLTDKRAKVEQIHQTMRDYLDAGIMKSYNDSVLFLKRRTSVGKYRYSLVVELDLETYSYTPGENRVRASEQTVLERIPPRLEVRKGASLECSHVQLLFNDVKNEVFASLRAYSEQNPPFYDFELNANGGHLSAWLFAGEDPFCKEVIQKLAQNNTRCGYDFEYLVGDGNHSLACAKKNWELIKQAGAQMDDPNRYALVELVNIYDEGLDFEPIHRIMINADIDQFYEFAQQYVEADNVQTEQVILQSGAKTRYLSVALTDGMVINNLQIILDEYLAKYHPNEPELLEYIHGESELRRLAQNPSNVGILVPAFARDLLFSYVNKNGPTQRKTFSIGQAADKRYYVEVRKVG